MSAAPSPPSDAHRLVSAIAAEGEPMSWRVIDTLSRRARNLYGTLEERHAELARWNSQGWGVFFVVNGGGTTKSEINEVRAAYADFDDGLTRAELDGRLAKCIPPSAIVQTSPGKWQVYWFLTGCPAEEIELYAHYLRELVRILESDGSATDLSRVLRVPGYHHTKREPVLSTLEECHPTRRYQWTTWRAWMATIAKPMPAPPPPAPPLAAPDRESYAYAVAALDRAAETVRKAHDGERNNTLNAQAIGPFGLAKGGHIDAEIVRQHLFDAAIEAGLDEGEVNSTLFSAAQAAKPRGVPASVDTSNAFAPPPGGFRQFVLIESADQMEKRMQSDKFVLDRLAILGQFTVIYGGPNMGKTLITLWLLTQQIEAGIIDGDGVFYINADDNSRGLAQKQRIAERYGFSQLAPGHQEFKASMLFGLMAQEVHAGTASDCIVILDTLKKFTDLMDKKVASEFGRVAREFVSAGGTLIGLAHVNKHKDGGGNAVHAGTTDIKDDADCVYILDSLGESSEGEKAVTFRNIKDRGDVLQEAHFAFASKEGRSGLTYPDLFDSVRMITADDARAVQQRREEERYMSEDAGPIAAISACISNATVNKTELIMAAAEVASCSKPAITKVLERYTGKLWSVSVGQRNANTYSLLPGNSRWTAAAFKPATPSPGKLKTRETRSPTLSI